jgi:hypothetical protein
MELSDQGVRKLLAIVRERIPKRFRLDPIREIQVLCPMNLVASMLAPSTSNCRTP